MSLRIPEVDLVRDDGHTVRLADELAAAPRAAVNFVFLGCTTVCPLGIQLFAEVQRRSGWGAGELRLLSVSIDPLGDRPADLAAHARRLGRQEGWSFYTGSVAAVELVQRAFGVWRPDRMDHPPVSFVRPAPAGGWRRLEGFPDPRDVLAELRRPVGHRDA